MTIEQYRIPKTVWTEADFDQMSWHDVHVHAVAFRPDILELWLDIDYIFSWVAPQQTETYYSFWVAPATLIFENVYDLEFTIGSRVGEMSLQGIGRTGPSAPRFPVTKQHEWHWLLEFNEGQMTFSSVGFTQFTRRLPTLVQTQRLGFEQRGGISFERAEAS